MVALIDEHDRVLCRKRLADDLKQITQTLQPWREEFQGLVVASTYIQET